MNKQRVFNFVISCAIVLLSGSLVVLGIYCFKLTIRLYQLEGVVTQQQQELVKENDILQGMMQFLIQIEHDQPSTGNITT